jgi:cytochrome c oxidase subunit 2
MQSTLSRIVCCAVIALPIVFFGSTFLSSGGVQTSERVVKITARKFEYRPHEIRLKVGEPVVLELVSKDVTHGFNIPDLGLRADLEPGETARVRLVPEKPGTFEFYCDNFCGIDHENMSAVIIVQ